MYGIKLDGEYVVLNAKGTGYERHSTFEDAVDAEALYPDYATEIIEL